MIGRISKIDEIGRIDRINIKDRMDRIDLNDRIGLSIYPSIYLCCKTTVNPCLLTDVDREI